ncbi:MAG TPA: galactokinase [Mycobacteriales bacterium]|jgi:galactokinase|nr:galactokinase [Mycobacteriales bacterium]
MTDAAGSAMAAADGFEARFGRRPAGVWSSPGRVNLIGEHTDHQGGVALPFAIDRHTFVAAAPRDDGMVCVGSAQHEGELVEAAVRDWPVTGRWADYPLGVGFVLHDEGLATTGADLWIDSTLPAGSGLSSSAALTCATALALLDLAGTVASRERVARVARRAETEVVGAPVGLLDQTAVLFAEAGTALLIDFQERTPTHTPVALPGAPWQLVVIDTRVRHSNATSGYADRRTLLEQARLRLELDSLSALDLRQLRASEGRLSAAEYDAVHHIVSENARVLDTVAALGRDDVIAVGDLMVRSHESLRDDLQVSCPELDLAVLESLDAGAVGARMTGGGFGGSAIALVETAYLSGLAARVEAAFQAAAFTRPEIFAVHPVAGAGRVEVAG